MQPHPYTKAIKLRVATLNYWLKQHSLGNISAMALQRQIAAILPQIQSLSENKQLDPVIYDPILYPYVPTPGDIEV